jgi:hypothetical protein
MIKIYLKNYGTVYVEIAFLKLFMILKLNAMLCIDNK